mmetsp:Transcript_73670/g.137678  ORF Transcript_73670/g.137678 Transcript_73670/m.137678 type:complete len:918 (-) Transcript_73670:45-2798(-)
MSLKTPGSALNRTASDVGGRKAVDTGDVDSPRTNKRFNRSKTTDVKGKRAAKAKAAPPLQSPADRAREEFWECRMHQTRRWGRTLEVVGGSEATTVKKLGKTLSDSRAKSELALRRTALEALVPAAATGNSEALALQTDALGDPSVAIRNLAMHTLQAAAGGKRAESGSAVALALQNRLPHRRTQWDIDTRSSCAQAIQQLVPRGDLKAQQICLKWLKDDAPAVRCAAVQALGEVGQGASDVEAVGAMLRDPQWQVKRAAIKALVLLSALEPAATQRMTPLNDSPKPKRAAKRTTGMRSPGQRGSLPSNKRDAQARRGSTGSDKGSLSSGPSKTLTRRGSASSIVSITSSKSGRVAKNVTKISPLAKLPETDRDRAVMQLARACKDADLRGQVLAEAVEAMGMICQGGIGLAANTAAVEACSARLGDPDMGVRQAAVTALQILAANDNTATQRGAAGLISHTDYRARGAALEVLTVTAAEGLQPVVDSYFLAAANLEVADWAGRRGVPPAFQKLAQIGTQDTFDKVLAVLIPRLEHHDWSIRRKAVQALVEALKTQGGTNHAVRFVKSYLKDPEEEVRRVLAMALPYAAPTKSKAALALAGHLCEDVDPDVRLAGLAAVSALAAVERSRSRKAIAICIKCIQGADDDLRAAAVQTLKVIADGRRTAIDSLTEVFAHPDERVHLAAAEAFALVGKTRFERAERRVVKLLRSTDPVVRTAATAAMAMLFGKEPKSVQQYKLEQEYSVEAQVAIEAASRTVGRFRRRYEGPGGYLLDTGDATQQGVDIGLQSRQVSPLVADGVDDEADSDVSTSQKPRDAAKAPKPAIAPPPPPPPMQRKRSASISRQVRQGITGIQALQQDADEQELERRRKYLEENSDDEEDFSESGSDVDDVLDLPEDLIAASLRSVAAQQAAAAAR